MRRLSIGKRRHVNCFCTSRLSAFAARAMRLTFAATASNAPPVASLLLMTARLQELYP